MPRPFWPRSVIGGGRLGAGCRAIGVRPVYARNRHRIHPAPGAPRWLNSNLRIAITVAGLTTTTGGEQRAPRRESGMSHEHPADNKPALPGDTLPVDEAQQRRLAAQAHAAAEQALQLARLAQESAELARRLNSQVLLQTRDGLSGPARNVRLLPAAESDAARSSDSDATPQVEPLLSATVEPWQAKVRTRRQSDSSRRRLCDRIELRQGPATSVEEVTPVRIQVRRQDRDKVVDRRSWRDVVRNWKSLVISTGLHALVIALLGALTFGLPSHPIVNTVIARFAEEDDQPLIVVDEPETEPEEEAVEEVGEQQVQSVDEEVVSVTEAPEVVAPEVPPLPEQPPQELASTEEPGPEPVIDPSPLLNAAVLSHRAGDGKAYLLKKYGGSAASESAVTRALDWFASVQRRDGSWNFNDIGRATETGKADSPMGGTSYVLLSFLGAGQTHQSGTYQEVVNRGLNYLLQNGRAVPAGGDFRGRLQEEKHSFYVQGAATLALAEAAIMTGDRRLRKAAQGAGQFIISAQDPGSGGWRYEPRSTGCTSVTSLQLLAIKSVERLGLAVSPRVYAGVSHFFDTVKCDADPTGRYCYQAEAPSFNSPSTSQALLSRMYLGVPREDEDLQAGVVLLDEKGPYTNRYFCYYATQVLKNWGGPEWERWNDSLREELLRTQVTQPGPEHGSWPPLDRTLSSVHGGRLFNTCLCTMTLEVYYRYPPLYDDRSETGVDSQQPHQ